MDVGELVVRQGIAKDAQYVGHMIRDLNDANGQPFSAYVAFCIAPYISLFAHESYRQMQVLDPTLAPQLSQIVEPVVARSRHSLKLFEDTKRGIDGQLKYFREEILSAHGDRFLGNTWVSLARLFKNDLGLYFYDKHLITTTHSATFHLGLEPKVLLKSSGPQIRSFYEDYGKYFYELGARLDAPGRTFIAKMDSNEVGAAKDVRSVRYYKRVFNGEATPDLNALLTVFRGMLNFVGKAMSGSGSNITYSAWKIRYLTLYQVLGSLNILHDEQPSRLDAQSAQRVGQIVNSVDAQLILNKNVKPFRNTLMHYNLDNRVDKAKVDLKAPLFGLVPIYFPGYDPQTLSGLVDRCITDTAAVMEEWGERVSIA